MSDELCTDEALELTGRPVGAECVESDDCILGACGVVPQVSSWGDPESVLVCGECEADLDCEGEEVCGLVFDERTYGHRECVAPSEASLGEACASDGECDTGVCCEGQCSECCEGEGCDEDESCARHDGGQTGAPLELMPFFCDAGEGLRLSGEACMDQSDCAGSVCDASANLSLCDPDGRPCDADSDCPLVDFGATCVEVGPLDGVCR